MKDNKQKAPAFFLYASDFIVGTMYLNNEQVGKFIRLLCHQNNKYKLSEELFLEICENNLDDKVAKMFIKDDEGFYYNNYLRNILEKRAAKSISHSKKQSANAVSGHKKRKAEKEQMQKDENTSEPVTELYPTFEDFYDLYDKKIGNKSAMESKFNKLPQKVKEKIIDYLPEYIQSTPDKTYRKNPQTLLNNKSWADEIIYKTNEDGNNNQYANLERLIEANNI